MNQGNSILSIRPYKKGPSTWVFDEPAMGIFAEPFVGEINQMIDAMLVRAGLIPGEQFTALFSASYFPGCNMKLEHWKEESGGNWYHDVTAPPALGVTTVAGWLCPCLFKFFREAPEFIYVRAEK